jgi:hypothetical protein
LTEILFDMLTRTVVALFLHRRDAERAARGGDRLAVQSQRGSYAGPIRNAQNFLMLSEMAEFLLESLYGVHQQVCPTCAAKMMGCTREEMVKATKELILNGLVLAENGICSACQDAGPVARLRRPRF